MHDWSVHQHDPVMGRRLSRDEERDFFAAAEQAAALAQQEQREARCSMATYARVIFNDPPAAPISRDDWNATFGVQVVICEDIPPDTIIVYRKGETERTIVIRNINTDPAESNAQQGQGGAT